jgi:hypothetical protein
VEARRAAVCSSSFPAPECESLLQARAEAVGGGWYSSSEQVKYNGKERYKKKKSNTVVQNQLNNTEIVKIKEKK